jgi:uncharacterized membrane protein
VDKEKREYEKILAMNHEKILAMNEKTQDEEDQVNVGASTSGISNFNCKHIFLLFFNKSYSSYII